MPPFKPGPCVALIVLVSTGCGTGRAVMGDGPIQKRRFRPGWHVDVARRSGPADTHRTDVDHQLLAFRPVVWPVADPLIADPATVPLPVGPATVDHPTSDHRGKAVSGLVTQAPEKVLEPEQDEQVDERPKKAWNHWALPSLGAALGTVALGLFGTSTVAVIIAVVTTLVLASTALRRGRKNDLAGKGFALAAMILGMIAAIATLAVIAVVGF